MFWGEHHHTFITQTSTGNVCSTQLSLYSLEHSLAHFTNIVVLFLLIGQGWIWPVLQHLGYSCVIYSCILCDVSSDIRHFLSGYLTPCLIMSQQEINTPWPGYVDMVPTNWCAMQQFTSIDAVLPSNTDLYANVPQKVLNYRSNFQKLTTLPKQWCFQASNPARIP